ncbi:hypothetical protein [Pseudonocardia endophytica]|uniref:Integral membrane protein n=1 Tax=Pseudonocardia endophytica TaxID=401976 RepID=A0A4R1HJ82_PSEEN|nr:hypothetical protein [Pseudonocardia endophytica]TCK22347.1 hypothetical protein EV378_6349 [Pseudonocardia endophytica]
MARSRNAAVVLEIVMAAAAVGGGVGLMADNAIGMTDDWLAATGFASWTVPGLLLILVVAVPTAVAAVLEIRGAGHAAEASVVAGLLQVGWILAQLVVVQRYVVLQPVVLACGVAVVALRAGAVRRSRRAW